MQDEPVHKKRSRLFFAILTVTTVILLGAYFYVSTYPPALVKRWRLVDMTSPETTPSEIPTKEILTLKSDHTFAMASSTNGNASNLTGPWYVYKNQLHLNSDWDSVLEIVSCSDNTLTLRSDGVTYTFTGDPNIAPHDADWHYQSEDWYENYNDQ